MNQARRDCKIPSYMVPKCPVCGGSTDMNLRTDNYFVRENSNINLIRLNLDQAIVPESFGKRAVGINEDMARCIGDMARRVYFM